ncbi:MAG TPA: GFA family protein, partial [Candidatus Polarisedimenticolaceae bacterium]|nr:GFA family protein [Candidatus Polarisedimenticolaceae bacterium]
MAEPIRGSCLCGAVRFEVDPPFLRAGHCHCSRCRKHGGTAQLTQGRVPRERFRLLAGAGAIVRYQPAPGAASKAFCRNCGSSLFGGSWPEGPEVSIRFGALDDDPGLRPQYHTFVDSQASWDAITDALPRHPGAWSPAAAVGDDARAILTAGYGGRTPAALVELLQA